MQTLEFADKNGFIIDYIMYNGRIFQRGVEISSTPDLKDYPNLKIIDGVFQITEEFISRFSKEFIEDIAKTKEGKKYRYGKGTLYFIREYAIPVFTFIIAKKKKKWNYEYSSTAKEMRDFIAEIKKITKQ